MVSRGSKNRAPLTDGLKKDDILALDLATFTGYYSIHESGTWNFAESKKRNDNKQHKAFYETLLDFIQKYNIKFIVAEDVNVNNYFSDIRKLSQFHGLLLLLCDELCLPEPYYVNVTSLKKWATGDGRATKDKMIQACIDKYNYQPQDDNAADACHLYFYFIRKYRIS